jgi:long-chain acyl-CoA synthetase
VEEVILSHPAVEDVRVAGIPDDYQGEAVKAWIVLAPGQQLSVDEIRKYARQKLVGYKVPRHVEFRDSLPKSAMGKVLRRELVAQEAGKTHPEAPDPEPAESAG